MKYTLALFIFHLMVNSSLAINRINFSAINPLFAWPIKKKTADYLCLNTAITEVEL